MSDWLSQSICHPAQFLSDVELKEGVVGASVNHHDNVRFAVKVNQATVTVFLFWKHASVNLDLGLMMVFVGYHCKKGNDEFSLQPFWFIAKFSNFFSPIDSNTSVVFLSITACCTTKSCNGHRLVTSL
jgi:hypothetical protein